jgi:hypothetical protein
MRAHGWESQCRKTQDGRHKPEDKYNDFLVHENVTPEQNGALIGRNDCRSGIARSAGYQCWFEASLPISNDLLAR